MKIFTTLSLIVLSVFPSFKIEESEGLLSYIVDNVVSCELSSKMMNKESMTESMEVLMTHKPSKNMQGFVHLAKGVIYNNIHDYDSALSEFKKAKAILFNTGEIHHYLTAVLCAARTYIQSGQYSSALFQMDIIRNNYKTLCPEQLSYYYDIMLCNNSHYSLLPNVKIVQEYMSQVDGSFINWGLIIKVLLQSGEFEDCVPFYDKEILPGRFVSHSEVILIKSFILDSMLGLSKYQQIYKECPLDFGFAPNINASLIKDIEIRHNNMIMDRNRKNLICIFTIIIAVFAIGYYIAGVSKYHKFEEQLTKLLSDKERSQLIRRRLQLSSDVLHSVDKRLRLLDNYILAYMSGNYINEANGHLKQ